jgi:hypothetical protein
MKSKKSPRSSGRGIYEISRRNTAEIEGAFDEMQDAAKIMLLL